MKTQKLRISTAIILMTICLIANLLNAQIIGNPTPIDDCCDLKYPAQQIGVEGGDLLDHFIPVFSSSINGKYKIHFTPTPTYKNISQAYINYVNALYPCATGMGSKIVISQGSLGGHTQRRMVKERFIGFAPLIGGGNSFSTNAPDIWDDYYSTPVALASPGSATYNSTNGLLPNVIYGIEYGTWIEGCNALTKKEKDCLGYFNYQKFRVQSPLFSARSANKTLILEILDEKNNVIGKKEIKVKEEKRKKIKKSNRSKFERRN